MFGADLVDAGLGRVNTKLLSLDQLKAAVEKVISDFQLERKSPIRNILEQIIIIIFKKRPQ